MGGLVVGNFPGIRIVSLPPKTRSITGKTVVVYMNGGNPDTVMHQWLKVPHHIVEAGFTGYIDALAFRESDFGCHRGGEGKSES